MVQHPGEHRAVARDHGIEEALACPVHASLLGFGGVVQQLRAHHGRERERNHRRYQDGDGQRDGEFPKQASHHIAHEKQRDQHGNQGEGERNDRKANLLRTLERRLQRRITFLDVAGDVFDHHDRIVDHKACGDGECHQCEVIDREPRQIHEAEGAHQRNRHRNAGNGRGPGAAQEKENHHHDEEHGEQQFHLHVLHRSTDGGGPVGENFHVNRCGQRGLQLRHQGLHLVNHFDHVGAGLALDVDDDGRRLIGPRREAHVLGVIDDFSDIRESDGTAITIGNHQSPVIIGRLQLVVGVDGGGPRRTVEAALGLVDVGRTDGGAQVIQGQSIGGQRFRIGAHAHRGALPAGERHEAHARYL